MHKPEIQPQIRADAMAQGGRFFAFFFFGAIYLSTSTRSASLEIHLRPTVVVTRRGVDIFWCSRTGHFLLRLSQPRMGYKEDILMCAASEFAAFGCISVYIIIYLIRAPFSVTSFVISGGYYHGLLNL